MNTALSLFAGCPLPGCANLVDDPRWPCGRCERDLAGYIRPASVSRPAEVVAAELAGRDTAVAAVYADRRRMVPLPEPPAAAEPAGGYKLNQLCWCCEERRKCRQDPDKPGQWICAECEAIPC